MGKVLKGDGTLAETAKSEVKGPWPPPPTGFWEVNDVDVTGKPRIEVLELPFWHLGRIGLQSGHWTVSLIDAANRISGRMSMLATVGCFWTMSHNTHSFIQLFFSTIFDVNDLEGDLKDFHWNCGIQVILWTVPHVWVVVLPMMSGFGVRSCLGMWDFPFTERSPSGVNAFNYMVTLSLDYWLRLVFITLLLCVLLPLSVRWMNPARGLFAWGNRWHIFVAVWYFWDMIRRHSHPHAWVFVTPFFVWWLIDKLYTQVAYSWKLKDVKRHMVTKDYMAITFCHPQKSRRVCLWSLLKWTDEELELLAPLWRIKTPESRGQYPRPFTSMLNRDKRQRPFVDSSDIGSPKHAFPVKDGQMTIGRLAEPLCGGAGYVGTDDHEYDEMFLIKIYHTPSSQTKFISEMKCDDVDLWGFGPNATDYQLVAEMLQENAPGRPMAIFASGSGAGLFLDTLDWMEHFLTEDRSDRLQSKVHLFYCTENLELWQLVANHTCAILSQPRVLAKLAGQVEVSLFCTDKTRVNKIAVPDNLGSCLNVRLGRWSEQARKLLEEKPNTTAFFCGGVRPATELELLCLEVGAQCHIGHKF